MPSFIKATGKVSVRTALLAPIILLLITGCSFNGKATEGQGTEEVHIKGVIFKLELALTPEERAQGLMGRETIAKNGGMLFVFPDDELYPAELTFWMKDCLVPIDLLFLDPAGRIEAIHEMQPPPPGTPDEELTVYASGVPAQFAIELQGGRAAGLGLQVGDVIELRFTELLLLAE